MHDIVYYISEILRFVPISITIRLYINDIISNGEIGDWDW
jgi:hypothetical protein